MTTMTLIAAVLGALVPPVVIAQALRSKANDRWPEGLLERLDQALEIIELDRRP